MMGRFRKISLLQSVTAVVSLAAVVGVGSMGVSMVRMLEEEGMYEVMAAEDKADSYLISVRDEVDRLLEEQRKSDEAEWRDKVSELEDADEANRRALEDHVRDADGRFQDMDGRISEVMADVSSGTDGSAAASKDMGNGASMAVPAMGEEGFNEP